MSGPRYSGFEIQFGDDDGDEWKPSLPRSIKTNGSVQDNAAAMEALRLLFAIRGEAAPGPRQAAVPAASAPLVVPRGHKVGIGKACQTWLDAIKAETLPKTHSIKRAAVESFAAHYGPASPVSAATREDVSAWVQALRNSGLATPTLANKTGYLTTFLDWCVSQGYCAAYPTEKHNPARGVVVYRKKDKRRRTKETGYKPYTPANIAQLFAPSAMEGLPADARWGVILGLYTGARVSELGQLTLDDFLDVSGVPCIRLTDEQPGQSLKTEASRRIIPLHPDLIKLGILKRTETLRAGGKTRFFPAVKVGGVNGAGNWLSKAFMRYRLSVGLEPPGKGKHGFHSFRSTLIQALQDKKIPAEVRAAYVGHELDDEHHGSYSRDITAQEMVDAITQIKWGLTIAALCPMLDTR